MVHNLDMEHTTLIFTFGFVFAFVALAVLLKTPRRLRKAARVLVAIANALEGKSVVTEKMPPPAAAVPAVDPLQADVVSALLNFESRNNRSKQRSAELAEIVSTVIAQKPGAGFDETFRAALKLVTKPARVAAA